MIRALLLLMASAAGVAAAAAPIPEEDDAAKVRRLYGTWVNPEPKCRYALKGEALCVKLPAGTRVYRPGGLGYTTAPHALKEVSGDSNAVVRITGPFPDRTPGVGCPSVRGGLVADDGTEFIHFWRGVGDVNGGPEGFFRTHSTAREVVLYGRQVEKAAEAAYLRLKREGQSVLTGWSRDGKEWKYQDPARVGWGAKVKVGVVAENTLDIQAEVTFDRYTLTQPKKGPEGSP